MKKPVDYRLFFTVLILMIFGMIMISSVSVYSSFRVTNIMAKNGYIDSAYNYFYVLRNIGHVFISLVLLGIIVKLKYKLFEKYSKYIFGVALTLLIIVLIMGATYKGARGWISIPGVPFNLQPTEFLKLSIIIFFAAFFSKKHFLGHIGKLFFAGLGIFIFLSIILLLFSGIFILYGFNILTLIIGIVFLIILNHIYIFIITSLLITRILSKDTLTKIINNKYLNFTGIIGLVVLLVGLQPDFGTIMVIVPVSIIMYFYAGINLKHLIITILIGFILIFGVYSAGDYDKETGKNLNTLGYITQRIDNFLADNEKLIKNKTINYQTEQALVAIGSGGFNGLGFGGSIQKFGYLPEVQGDFIFSVIIEELGFVGGLILIGMYLYIGYRGIYIANRVSDLFAKYTAIGISSRILIQAFINIGVNLNIVPLTGITLPFVSYGGSSLLSLVIGLAILLSISRDIDSKKGFSRIDRKKIMF